MFPCKFAEKRFSLLKTFTQLSSTLFTSLGIRTLFRTLLFLLQHFLHKSFFKIFFTNFINPFENASCDLLHDSVKCFPI